MIKQYWFNWVHCFLYKLYSHTADVTRTLNCYQTSCLQRKSGKWISSCVWTAKRSTEHISVRLNYWAPLIFSDLQKWWNCNLPCSKLTSSNIQYFCVSFPSVCLCAGINLLLTEYTCLTFVFNQFCRLWACCEWSMISFWQEWRVLWGCQVVSVCIHLFEPVFVIVRAKC